MEADPTSVTALADSRQNHPVSSSSSFVLRELISEVPLDDAHITCVDVWNGNLYIGTSAGEVLHYVSLPSDSSNGPSFIFATKLQPPFTSRQDEKDVGVKQILLLPDVSKACILCNGTLTFYTLPELSPAFGGRIQQAGCLWVGGIDQETGSRQAATPSTTKGTVIVICLRQKLRLIRVADDARSIRNIELGGVSALERRGDLACVSENGSYSLLDLVNQRKNELFPISSEASAGAPPSAPDTSTLPFETRSKSQEPSQRLSTTSPVRTPASHERQTSLDTTRNPRRRTRMDRKSPWPARRSSRQIESPPDGSLSREPSPTNAENAVHSQHNSVDIALPSSGPLVPNILSLESDEFLVTIGTKMTEPGVGMFVNSEGDVVRGSLDFSSYPEHLVLERSESEATGQAQTSGYAVAVVQRPGKDGLERAIEIQRWNVDPGENNRDKEWLRIGPVQAEQDLEAPAPGLGLRLATDHEEILMEQVVNRLRLRRFHIKGLDRDMIVDEAREREEDHFASRFAKSRASVLFYNGAKVFWMMRNPLITQLDEELSQAVNQNAQGMTGIEGALVSHVMNSLRGQDARDELEFHTLAYIRQKCSLLFLGRLMLQTAQGALASERDKSLAEEALLAGEIDPRIILALFSDLREEVVSEEAGIWVSQGLAETANEIRALSHSDIVMTDPQGAYGSNVLLPVKRYLLAWRKKKGLASVADEAHVASAVDAALLRILLMLDHETTSARAVPGSPRAELNKLVDDGVDCFDRAVDLLEQYHRLYMLSRLYQGRTMVAQVLSTWKRIIEGEHDAGGELVDGERMVRGYLPKLRDQNLVQEYGCWLARRNAPLGVRVFADSNSKVKFQPSEVVEMLRSAAPGAVKDYLEHLVFGQNRVEYVNELIGFYVDSVVNELDSSEESRDLLLQSYSVYRSLQPPKPTYRHFIIDNAIDAAWWQNRLRLLQLLDGSLGTALTHDLGGLRERLAKHERELLPEVIVLYGREGRHEEALRLLTHGLADYDTAIRYCLREGSSIFHPSMATSQGKGEASKDNQKQLFELLLNHLMEIEDEGERMERAAELLDRFGGWFDLAKVIELIPETWPVEQVAGFLVQALRRSLSERHETALVKALSGAQNLRHTVELIDKLEESSATVVTSDETANS